MDSGLKRQKKKTWKAFSEFTRRRYANQKGQAFCVTCGVRKHWKKLQSGHFLDGRGNAILFEEKACFPQCYSCNICKHGNKIEYYIFMKNTFGEAAINQLRDQAKQKIEFTVSGLKDMEMQYIKAVKRLPW
jgi:hypothetical protein